MKATDCGTFVIRAPPADNLKQKGDDRRLEVVTSSELEEFLEINQLFQNLGVASISAAGAGVL